MSKYFRPFLSDFSFVVVGALLLASAGCKKSSAVVPAANSTNPNDAVQFAITQGASDALAARDATSLAGVFDGRRWQLAACLPQDFQFEVNVDFALAADGKASAVKAEPAELATERCIQTVLEQTRFAASTADTQLRVTLRREPVKSHLPSKPL